MAARTLTGSAGMSRIEYLGKQMGSIWSGDVTNTAYTFGVDRPRGWVDTRDLGSRDPKKGFLGKQDRVSGDWLFRDITDSGEQVSVQTTVQLQPEPETVTQTETGIEGTTEVTGQLTATRTAAPETEYNPSAMNVEQIKALVDQNLSKTQWVAIYKAELADRNRKGAVAFMEELLANWQD